MGTEAADVFPYLCTLLNSLCSGILAYSAIASRMRWFAWWNRKKSTSSGVRPLAFSASAHDLLEAPHGVGEDRPPVHRRPGPPVVDLLLRHDRVGRGAVDLAEELVEDRAVLVEVVRDEPAPRARVDRLEHDGPGAVREQDGHVAASIGVLEHRRQRLGADHEHPPVGADPDERVGHRQRVHEPGAPLLEVQHRRRREAELRGHHGPGVGVRVLGMVVVTMMKSMSSILRPAFLRAISAASRPRSAGVSSASIFPSTPRS